MEVIDTAIQYLLTTQYAPYALIAITFCYLIVQVMPHLPPKVTAKIPNWVMLLLNRIAGNYKNTSNLLTGKDGNIR